MQSGWREHTENKLDYSVWVLSRVQRLERLTIRRRLEGKRLRHIRWRPFGLKSNLLSTALITNLMMPLVFVKHSLSKEKKKEPKCLLRSKMILVFSSSASRWLWVTLFIFCKIRKCASKIESFSVRYMINRAEKDAILRLVSHFWSNVRCCEVETFITLILNYF